MVPQVNGWHWSERSILQEAKAELELLVSQDQQDEHGYTITSLQRLGGNIDTALRRGKRKLQYGLTAEFEWMVVLDDGQTCTGAYCLLHP